MTNKVRIYLSQVQDLARKVMAFHILCTMTRLMQIGFLLFGILPGSVGLRGFFEEAAGDKDTVKVRLLRA